VPSRRRADIVSSILFSPPGQLRLLFCCSLPFGLPLAHPIGKRIKPVAINLLGACVSILAQQDAVAQLGGLRRLR
jgi:hypothetical protein